jgi:hypothetical protein
LTKAINEAKIVFSTNGNRKQTIYMQKLNLDRFLHPSPQLTQNDHKPNVKYNTIKHPKDSTGKNLEPLGSGNELLNVISTI